MTKIRIHKKKKWKYMFAAVGFLGIALLCLFAVLEYQNAEKYKQQVAKLDEQLTSYQHMVYVTTEKLSKGTVITEENVSMEIRYSDSSQYDFITEEDFGKVLVLDVPMGTCLTTAMLCAAGGNVRQIFFSQAELPEHLLAGNRIDVRIRYKNAEDYIVLADKILLYRDSESGILLELTEEEILFLSSAMSDLDLYGGTRLYVAGYPEYGQVESSTVTYIANQGILMLLGREKSEGESRTALEERLLQRQ